MKYKWCAYCTECVITLRFYKKENSTNSSSDFFEIQRGKAYDDRGMQSLHKKLFKKWMVILFRINAKEKIVKISESMFKWNREILQQ